MKIRLGHVSNSSSSSFTIISDRPLTHEKLRKVLGVPRQHPLKNMVDEIIDCIMKRAELATREDLEEWYDEEYIKKYTDLMDNGKSVYFGSFSDDDWGSIEGFLCHSNLDVDVPGLKIDHEGGY